VAGLTRGTRPASTGLPLYAVPGGLSASHPTSFEVPLAITSGSCPGDRYLEPKVPTYRPANLDANLVLASDDQNHAVLQITGVYRPPLDGLGEELDQLVLHQVASATLKSLLREIAGRLASETARTASQDLPVRERPAREIPPDHR
jgi:hypothetical protein